MTKELLVFILISYIVLMDLFALGTLWKRDLHTKQYLLISLLIVCVPLLGAFLIIAFPPKKVSTTDRLLNQ